MGFEMTNIFMLAGTVHEIVLTGSHEIPLKNSCSQMENTCGVEHNLYFLSSRRGYSHG